MTTLRRQPSGELKAKVVLEALRGERTINEIAADYGVHPLQITQWKKVVLEGRPGVSSWSRLIDWCSRYVLSWAVSITREVPLCVEALEEALRQGQPEIFNTDQGAQFTRQELTARLKDGGVRISMDGRPGPGQRLCGAVVAQCDV